MSRITSVELQNFRGIRRGRVGDLAEVNVVVGRNNSGKSSVAEAIMRVAQSAAGRRDVLNRYRAELWAAARNEPNWYEREVWYRGRDTEEFRVRLAFNGGEAGGEIFGSAGHIDGSPVAAAHRPFVERITLFRPSDAMNSAIERGLWGQALKTRADKRIAGEMKDIFNLAVEQVQVLPDGRVVLLFPDYALSLDVFGDGTRAAFRCLIMMSVLEETMLIIEDIEAHQSPEALKNFAATLCRLARAQKLQLFVTTHSVECIRAFTESGVDTDQVGVVQLRLSEGELDSRRLTVEAAGQMLSAGIDLRMPTIQRVLRPEEWE